MDAIDTEAFERLSWHDCHIWRLDLHAGTPAEDDWTSDLVLGIDFIVEWLCGIDGRTRFRVAPARLAFHGVTDLQVHIACGDGGPQTALHELSIDRIERERVRDQQVFLDLPYYRWRIRLNWPAGGEIAFGAFGFTQTLRAEPVLTEAQQLTRGQRRRLLGLE